MHDSAMHACARREDLDASIYSLCVDTCMACFSDVRIRSIILLGSWMQVCGLPDDLEYTDFSGFPMHSCGVRVFSLALVDCELVRACTEAPGAERGAAPAFSHPLL